ncbi:Integrator complex subunit 2, partial [Cladochytrium tenue]
MALSRCTTEDCLWIVFDWLTTAANDARCLMRLRDLKCGSVLAEFVADRGPSLQPSMLAKAYEVAMQDAAVLSDFLASREASKAFQVVAHSSDPCQLQVDLRLRSLAKSFLEDIASITSHAPKAKELRDLQADARNLSRTLTNIVDGGDVITKDIIAALFDRLDDTDVNIQIEALKTISTIASNDSQRATFIGPESVRVLVGKLRSFEPEVLETCLASIMPLFENKDWRTEAIACGGPELLGQLLLSRDATIGNLARICAARLAQHQAGGGVPADPWERVSAGWEAAAVRQALAKLAKIDPGSLSTKFQLRSAVMMQRAGEVELGLYVLHDGEYIQLQDALDLEVASLVAYATAAGATDSGAEHVSKADLWKNIPEVATLLLRAVSNGRLSVQKVATVLVYTPNLPTEPIATAAAITRVIIDYQPFLLDEATMQVHLIEPFGRVLGFSSWKLSLVSWHKGQPYARVVRGGSPTCVNSARIYACQRALLLNAVSDGGLEERPLQIVLQLFKAKLFHQTNVDTREWVTSAVMGATLPLNPNLVSIVAQYAESSDRLSQRYKFNAATSICGPDLVQDAATMRLREEGVRKAFSEMAENPEAAHSVADFLASLDPVSLLPHFDAFSDVLMLGVLKERSINSWRRAASPDKQPVTHQELLFRPLTVFECDSRVFQRPVPFRAFLQVLESYLMASKRFYERMFETKIATDPKTGLNAKHLKALNDLQMTSAVQALLEICCLKELKLGNKEHLTEVREAVCFFVHQVFVGSTDSMRLLHGQGYATELIPLLVDKVPSMHFCITYIKDLLAGKSLEMQLFLVQLSCSLIAKYPLADSLVMAHELVLPAAAALGRQVLAQEGPRASKEPSSRLPQALPPLFSALVDLTRGFPGL